MSTVYIAACLRDRHPDVHLAMSKALAAADVPLVEVPGTGNIWIRDWMPIRSGLHLVKFQSKANVKKWPFLETIHADLPLAVFQEGIVNSGIILDGGNVVRSPDGKRVIMCEQTLVDNLLGDWGIVDHGLRGTLEKLLEAKIIWIPNEPFDTLGHADGVVSWIDDHHVFFNDYRSMRDVAYRDYGAEVRRRLEANGVCTVPFPNAYDECREITEARFRKEHPQADDFNMATGYYVNFLKVDDLILYPTFGIDRDNRCADALIEAWPDATIAGIDCGHLAEEGGLLHCVTWEG